MSDLEISTNEGGIVITKTDSSGKCSEIQVDETDALGLLQALKSLQDRAIAQLPETQGRLGRAVVYPVREINVGSDALQENVLLQVISLSGNEMLLSLPPEPIEAFARNLLAYVAEKHPPRGKPQ